MKPKVVDCFMFYNETDMLKFRLRELQDVVDHFVIVESTRTFAGHDRGATRVDLSRILTETELQKVIHVVVDDMPNGPGQNAWVNERHQRRCIDRGLQQLAPTLAPIDVILVSDVDEVFDAAVIRKLVCSLSSALRSNKIYRVPMDFYYYDLTCKFDFRWTSARMMTYEAYRTVGRGDPEYVRNGVNGEPFLVDLEELCGWHLSYFGDEAFVANKIREFSHQEFNTAKYTDPDYIRRCKAEGRSLFWAHEKTTRVPLSCNGYLPKHFRALLAPDALAD